MSDQNLPHIRDGRDAEDDDSEWTATIEYLDYTILDAHGWTLDNDLFEKAAVSQGVPSRTSAAFDVSRAGCHSPGVDARLTRVD